MKRGKIMKRIIGLVLATLLCAAVFVGCGSDESQGATEPYSVAKFNMLHDSTLPLDCDGDILIKNGYSRIEDLYKKQVENVKVGNIVLTGQAQLMRDESDIICDISYEYTNSTESTIEQLSEIYGQYSTDGSYYEWKLTLPDNSLWIVELYNFSDSSILSDDKTIRFYDKEKYDTSLKEYYDEASKKLTSEQKKILTQAVEIADSYLDFELDGDEARNRLDTLDQRYENLAKDDDVFGLYISMLSTRIGLNESNHNYDKEIIETRNTLASAVGISER